MSTPYFNALPINENAVKVNDIIEKGFNFAIRSVDRTKQFIGLKGREVPVMMMNILNSWVEQKMRCVRNTTIKV